MRLGQAGEAGPLWVRADEQTRGKGRRDRVWASPKGNLFASLLLVHPGDRRALPQLSHVAAVALVEAVRTVVGPIAGLALKWPNDLLIGTAKVAGILVEAIATPDDSVACIIGWGVNCLRHPGPLAYATTSLSLVTGQPIDPTTIFAELRPSMSRAVQQWDRGRGYEQIRMQWLSAALPVGTSLVVKRQPVDLTGEFQGIDLEGRLLLALAGKTVTVEAGDVFLEEQAAASVG